MTNDDPDRDDLVTLTCFNCGRRGDVKPNVLNFGSHLVAIEPTAGDVLIQWQRWSGEWVCHTCLADYATDSPEEAEAYYPEAVSDPEGGR